MGADKTPHSPAREPVESTPEILPSGARALLDQIIESLEQAKAEDIIVIDLTGKTSIADAMVIASGRSNTHVGAIADRLTRAMKETSRGNPRIEGAPQNDWVLVDIGDVIVHVFRPEVRQFYNLEKMWGVGRPADLRAN